MVQRSDVSPYVLSVRTPCDLDWTFCGDSSGYTEGSGDLMNVSGAPLHILGFSGVQGIFQRFQRSLKRVQTLTEIWRSAKCLMGGRWYRIKTL